MIENAGRYRLLYVTDDGRLLDGDRGGQPLTLAQLSALRMLVEANHGAQAGGPAFISASDMARAAVQT